MKYKIKNNIELWKYLKGETKRQIAREIKISESYLYSILTGNIECHYRTAKLINDFLNPKGKIEDIFEEKGD